MYLLPAPVSMSVVEDGRCTLSMELQGRRSLDSRRSVDGGVGVVDSVTGCLSTLYYFPTTRDFDPQSLEKDNFICTLRNVQNVRDSVGDLTTTSRFRRFLLCI